MVEISLQDVKIVKEEAGIKTTERWERTLSAPEDVLRRIVREELHKIVYETRQISDSEAEHEISDLIITKRMSDIKHVNAFEVFTELSLPIEQIEKILDKLEKEGKISVIDD